MMSLTEDVSSLFDAGPGLRGRVGNDWSEGSPPEAARLAAADVQASVLDHVGTVAALDFRNRPWVPGQPNRFSAGDRLVLEALIESVQRVTGSVTLAMLSHGASSGGTGR